MLILKYLYALCVRGFPCRGAALRPSQQDCLRSGGCHLLCGVKNELKCNLMYCAMKISA